MFVPSKSVRISIHSLWSRPVGQETAVVNKSAILGKVSGFNIWSMSKDGSEISYLSYGGGENEGDVISWSTVTNGIKGKVLVKTPSICKHHESKLREYNPFIPDLKITVLLTDLYVFLTLLAK